MGSPSCRPRGSLPGACASCLRAKHDTPGASLDPRSRPGGRRDTPEPPGDSRDAIRPASRSCRRPYTGPLPFAHGPNARPGRLDPVLIQRPAGPVPQDGLQPAAPGVALPRAGRLEGRLERPQGQELVRPGVRPARAEGAHGVGLNTREPDTPVTRQVVRRARFTSRPCLRPQPRIASRTWQIRLPMLLQVRRRKTAARGLERHRETHK
jgi:hypothetical protein